MNNKNNLLYQAYTPKDEQSSDINRMMFVALLPAMIMAVIFFGLSSLIMMVAAVLSCLFFEVLIRKYILKIPATLRSGTALITGILLAFNLPAGLPVWIVVAGSLVAVTISQNSAGKLFGHPFNAVLISRLLLRISFPVQMTTWPAVITETDALTGLTPLGMLKDGLNSGKTISQISSGIHFPPYFDLLWGNVNGAVGEISVVAVLMGGLYLLSKKIISWHMPVAIICSVLFFEGILWVAAPGSFMDPVFHLITGGTMLMAFFMATDPASTPATPKGKIIVGIGIGLITILVRNTGAFSEEGFLAVLTMNGLTPFVNKKTQPKQSD
ncbi:MAG: RnfABCDGE type electron transport complex subunit D [Prolixibacteraceae bacterium]